MFNPDTINCGSEGDRTQRGWVEAIVPEPVLGRSVADVYTN